jgi:hypothetical protein
VQWQGEIPAPRAVHLSVVPTSSRDSIAWWEITARLSLAPPCNVLILCGNLHDSFRPARYTKGVAKSATIAPVTSRAEI